MTSAEERTWADALTTKDCFVPDWSANGPGAGSADLVANLGQQHKDAGQDRPSRTWDVDLDAPILITGGSGLVGYAIRNLLNENGFSRIIAPRRSELDLLDTEATAQFLAVHQPQYVVHLAAVVFGLVGNMKNQALSIELNTLMNNNLFAAMRKTPVRRCFYAGTVASYPFPYPSLPLREAMLFDGLPHYGEFGYALAKRHAYSYMQILNREIGLEYTYGIFTNLYGENDRFDVQNGHVIPSLIAKAYRAAKDGGDFEVWGDGRARRDFLHAEDAARAILLCLQQGGAHLINISSQTSHSIQEVVEEIVKVTGLDAKFLPDAPVGILNRLVDNTALRQLGFMPRISLGLGIARTYEWYAQNQDKLRS